MALLYAKSRALRFEAESAVCVHPTRPTSLQGVTDLTTQVGGSLREAVAADDPRR